MVSTQPLAIIVANGEKVFSSAKSNQVSWTMKRFHFNHNFRILQLGGSDMVLGVDWMKQFSSVLMVCKDMTLSFQKDGKLMIIQGQTTMGNWKSITGNRMQKMTAKDSSLMDELYVLDVDRVASTVPNASSRGVRVVLSQEGRPIAYLNKALGPKHMDLSIYEKEYIAILMVVSKWRDYLEGNQFVIKPYHEPLKYLLEQNLMTTIQKMGLTKLLGLDYIIQYRKGKNNTVADAFSRQFEDFVEHNYIRAVSIVPSWVNEIKGTYEDDLLAKEWICVLSVHPHSHNNWKYSGGILRYQSRVYVGSKGDLRLQILSNLHDSPQGGHSGVQATYQRIKAHFYWSGLKKMVVVYVRKCDTCQRIKVEHIPKIGLLQPLPVPNQAWEIITMDFTDGLPKSNQKTCILVMNMAISNRDKTFTSLFWHDLMKQLGTSTFYSTTYHPKTDGQTKQFDPWGQGSSHEWGIVMVGREEGENHEENELGNSGNELGIGKDEILPADEMETDEISFGSIQAAESMHCGSISFGRFANEPLAWERKSSFSHNRYLEEVEKCSKPGSIIEKKAYFEAHFRKRALLQSSSSEGQNGGEYQNCKSDVMENEDYGEYQTGENDTDCVNKGSHYNHFDENGLSSMDYGENLYCGNEGSLFYHENEGNHFDHSNESSLCALLYMSPDDSEYLGEGALTESVIECPGLLSAHQTHISVPIDFEPEETSESQSGCAKSFISSDNPEKEVEENLDDDDADNIDETFESLDQSPNTEIQQNHSSKLKSATENRTIKPRLKSPVNRDHSQKNTFCDPSMVAAMVQERKEKEITKRTKPQKLPLQTAFPTRRSVHKSPKQEDSARARFNAKSNAENKSGNGPMTKKEIEAQPFSYKKIAPVVRQTPNRIKQTAVSTWEDAKSTARGFHFKSGERAEKRREFYTKVEKKNASQRGRDESDSSKNTGRESEKTEAEIKQLRKSLTFKAKPMPSFYHVPTTSRFTRNKAATSTMKSAKVGKKSPNSGIRAIPISPSRSREANKQALSSAGSIGELICPPVEPSRAGIVSPTPPTVSHSSPEPVTQNTILWKKERKKENSNLQKHRMSESSKVVKDHKSGGRPKVGGRRSNSELVTKNMKNAGMDCSSGIGRCAVMAP
ncbi:uncharacterized protein LOC120184271 [Hibiscus syriacus]|uniref:uncharacterized protein LOC120184271 n=1 Tax=Hibiscus syriacus TaxID=106335 RepID=UPI0019216874|nr:uncharacterized protein LOC120184271 [Hibiscus syriacus]